MSDLHLFTHFSALPDRVGHLPLVRRPTPVTALVLSGRSGPRSILVKRDDLSGLPYGGNKVRKLEFLLGEARREGADRLITAGAFGSHHALATTVYGRRLGLPVTCVLFPQRVTPHVREILRAIAAHGAELRYTRRLEGVPFAVLRARWVHRAGRACVIPPGGSSAAGTLGYVEAALELDAQIRGDACEAPSAIHVAAGTLGTAAGIAIGLAIAGRDIPVHAHRITSALVANARTLEQLVRRTLELLRGTGAEPPSPEQVLRLVRLRPEQLGDGYGRQTAAGEEATAVFAAAGLHLDPTYTAKAAAGLLAQQGERLPLFWLTLSAVEPDAPADVAAPLPEAFARALA